MLVEGSIISEVRQFTEDFN